MAEKIEEWAVRNEPCWLTPQARNCTCHLSCCVVSCPLSLPLSLSLSLFFSFFVSFSSIFLLFLLLLSASLYNTFPLFFTATFICTQRVPLLLLLPYSWAFLYRFLAFNPFITRRHCISYKPKSKEEREKETEKHSERRERERERGREINADTDTDFLPYCDVITR